jgi:large subunit ribosomal protein L13
MKTYTPRPRDIERRWYVIDARGAVLGRLASQVAAILRGKHKPIFAPHLDTGDHVIVVNAAEVRLTGEKDQKKVWRRHSGYPGGLTETSYSRLMAKRPASAVEKAVRGMLPKNSLGRSMARKLQVYAGPEHPHRAQSPQALTLGDLPRWEGLPAPAAPPKAATGPSPKRPRARTKAEAAETAERPAAKRPAAKRTTARAGSKASTATRASGASGTAKRASEGGSQAKTTAAKRTTSAKKTAAKKSTARRTKKEE